MVLPLAKFQFMEFWESRNGCSAAAAACIGTWRGQFGASALPGRGLAWRAWADWRGTCAQWPALSGMLHRPAELQIIVCMYISWEEGRGLSAAALE